MRRDTRGTGSVALERGQQRFDRWRRTRRTGARIPESLWTMAVRLATEHGVYRAARAFRLDYRVLKDRVGASEADGSSGEGPGPAFVELLPSGLAGASDCVVELEDLDGSRMRIHMKGASCPDVATLAKAFWRRQG